MKIIEYPHLAFTQAEFDNLVEIDAVTLSYKDNIADYYARIESYVKDEGLHRVDLEKLNDREVDLRAELKVINSQKREIRGKMQADIVRQRRAKIAIARTETRMTIRERQIFRSETLRRLRCLGKTVKLNRGKRAIAGSQGPEIEDLLSNISNETNEQSSDRGTSSAGLATDS